MVRFQSLLSQIARVKKPIYILLLFLCLGVNIYFRLFPAYFPQFHGKARKNVEHKIEEETSKQVESEYASFTPLVQKKIFQQALREKMQKEETQDKITKEYKKLRDKFQDSQGLTYLLGFDSFQWYRYTKNILDKGFPCDRIIDSNCYDDYMLAPEGKEVIKTRSFFYLSCFLYRVTTFFMPQLEFRAFIFYLPLFYTLVLLLLIYFFTKNIFSRVGAFFAVLFIGLNRLLLVKTCAGWFDYDVLTLILAVIISWLVAVSLSQISIKRSIVYVVLASLFVGVYSFTWLGYWWILIIALGCYLYFFMNECNIKGRLDKESLRYLIQAFVLILLSAFFVYIFLQKNLFTNIFVAIKHRLTLGLSEGGSIWPNVFYTVGELQKASAKKIITYLYGPVISVITVTGMLFIYLKERRSKKSGYILILLFWTFFMSFASLKGIRFVMFLSIPLGVFFGGVVEQLFTRVKRVYKDNVKKGIVWAFIFLLFTVWVGDKFISSAYKTALGQEPLMNDNWVEALSYIKNKTPKESIINSWWDYGNFFKLYGNRRVIFDGQSQNKPIAYWMANVLIAEKEDKALRILRMLNNSSDSLFKEIEANLGDEYTAVAFLNRLLDMDLSHAVQLVEEYSFPDSLKVKILRNIYEKKPAPAYFVVEKSMLGKITPISFLANWDFAKVFVAKNRGLPKDELLKEMAVLFSLTPEEAERKYREVMLSNKTEEKNEVLSKRFRYLSQKEPAETEGKISYFNNGVVFDSSEDKSRLFFPDGSHLKVKYLYFFEDGVFSSKEIEKADYKSGCLFIKEKDEWYSLLLSEELARSLLTRLYFLKGDSLNHFDLVYSDEEEGIYIYKINWDNAEN